jgi:hypothetical protein
VRSSLQEIAEVAEPGTDVVKDFMTVGARLHPSKDRMDALVRWLCSRRGCGRESASSRRRRRIASSRGPARS